VVGLVLGDTQSLQSRIWKITCFDVMLFQYFCELSDSLVKLSRVALYISSKTLSATWCDFFGLF
jgi:hypothetical protein